MATKKSATNSIHSKKELKKELAHKLEVSLPEIKAGLGKKKFNKRVKKATKLITAGLHLNGIEKKEKKNTDKKTAPAKKTETPKKATAEENPNPA